MRWCEEIVDELDSQSMSEEHLVEVASKERTMLLHSTRNAILIATSPANRSQVWALCWRQTGDWLWSQDTVFSYRCLTSPDCV